MFLGVLTVLQLLTGTYLPISISLVAYLKFILISTLVSLRMMVR